MRKKMKLTQLFKCGADRIDFSDKALSVTLNDNEKLYFLIIPLRHMENGIVEYQLFKLGNIPNRWSDNTLRSNCNRIFTLKEIEFLMGNYTDYLKLTLDDWEVMSIKTALRKASEKL